MKIVSVIVPLYNNEQYIESALNSLLLELPERLELLILDDGSTDSSFAIAERWLSDHGNRFYRTKIWGRANRGISATLNELVSATSGQYITILPADDELLPGGIDARISVLLDRPELLCVFGDAKVINESDELLSESALFDYPKRHVAAHLWALLDPRLIALEMIIRWSVPGPVFLAHRRVYSDVAGIGLYDESIRAEDRDYYLRNLAAGTIGYVDSKVAMYRVHTSNVSTNAGTSDSIRESVLASERKNLPRFSGIDLLALYCVYFYKKAVGGYISSDGLFAKGRYVLQAMIARLLLRVFDFVQMIRKMAT